MMIDIMLTMKKIIILGCTMMIGMMVSAGTINHHYQKGEHVELWVNKVGPYANPQEAYEFYTLPYCAPETQYHPNKGDDKSRFNEWKFQSIGEHLGGHRLRHTGHDITFNDNNKTESCTTKLLTAEQVNQFSIAIQHRWFYQMYLDDLPVWGMVGELLPNDQDIANKLLQQGASKGGEGKDDLSRLDKVSDVPELGDLVPYVYTTRVLKIKYNNDQIVQVDLTSDPMSLIKIEVGISYEFALNIQWESTTEEFHSRFDRYLDHDFFKHPIHWFSVFNSFMMVLFLMGLVALILLRTLKKDYARYGIINDLEDGIPGSTPMVNNSERDPLVDDEGDGKGHGLGGSGSGGDKHNEDAGWKQVHGDVFRAPIYLPLFASLLGTGWQLVVLTLGVIIFAVLGPLHGEVHEERGEMLHSVIVCYSLSSIVAGYQSGQFFKLYYPTTTAARKQLSVSASSSSIPKTSLWQLVMLLTVLMLPLITVSIMFVLNTVSLFYGTINTIPFLVIIKLFFIWVFVSVPLCIVGTLIGRHTLGFGSSTANKSGGGAGSGGGGGPLDHFPCRVNAIPRPIPEDVPWYGKPIGLIPLAGLLSFGSIFIELYYVLTSLWNYKFYHVYGFLLGVYAILTIVVGMTSIIVVYFCLNSENYLWQWTAFGSGACTALYVFLYGIYYYIFKTQMHGMLQFVFYFGYMILIACNLGILCGTLGHGAASKFVRAIFQNVKVD